MSKADDLRALSLAKKPKTMKKYLGIEVEFLLPERNVKELKDMLVEHDLQDKVHLGTDGSCRAADGEWEPQYSIRSDSWNGNPSRVLVNEKDRPIGREIRILVTESEALDVINTVCAIIQEAGGYANDSCGLHVHLDMRHRDVDKAYHNLYYMQGIMLKTQPKSRRSNDYCRPQYESSNTSGSHYNAINRNAAYAEHQTIEVRLHEGTVKARDIRMWVKFLTHLVNMQSELTTAQKSFKNVALPEEVRMYLNGRIKKYA